MFNSFFKERRASLFYLLLTVTAMMVSGCDNNVDNSIKDTGGRFFCYIDDG